MKIAKEIYKQNQQIEELPVLTVNINKLSEILANLNKNILYYEKYKSVIAK